MVNVLVVEDDINKLRRVQKVFEDINREDVFVYHESNASDAIKWLQENRCDVLILDLHIPARRDEAPSKKGGEGFLRKLVRADSQCSIPGHAVGLTAFVELRQEFRAHFEREGWVIAKYDQTSKDWEETVANTVKRELIAGNEGSRKGLLLALHGIRTTGDWQRTLADVAQSENWICPLQHMWYGRFSVFQFLSPYSRSAKVAWFRARYTSAMSAENEGCGPALRPSVVAHSFGTLILGNSLLRFKDIRFDSVILCGCILPKEFPWDVLIENGQVQRVLHDIGSDDVWSTICSFVVPGTGASGRDGFTVKSPALIEERHNLSHNEFFDARQMRKHWFGFLNFPHPQRAPTVIATVKPSRGDHPWVSPVLSTIVLLILVSTCVIAGYFVSKGIAMVGDVAIDCVRLAW